MENNGEKVGDMIYINYSGWLDIRSISKRKDHFILTWYPDNRNNQRSMLRCKSTEELVAYFCSKRLLGQCGVRIRVREEKVFLCEGGKSNWLEMEIE